MINKNKKFRFNIIDVLLILLVLAVVGVMYYFTVARNSVASNSEATIDYVVELKTVRREHIDNINICDTVVETVRDQQIGEVVDVEIVPAYTSVTDTVTGDMRNEIYPPINSTDINLDADTDETTNDETTNDEAIIDEITDGEPEELESLPEQEEELLYDYYNVKVTIRGKVKKGDKGYSINGFDVIVGQLVYFRVPHFVSSGYCISINEIN